MAVALAYLAGQDLPEPFAFPESRPPLFLLLTLNENQTLPFAWQSDTTWREAFVVDWQGLRMGMAVDFHLHLEVRRPRRSHPVEERRYLAIAAGQTLG